VVIGAAYVICGAAYEVVIICGAAAIWYEGMNAEVVASGMRAGSKGATSTSGSAAGAGAGAAFFFLVALFLDFLEEAAATPMQVSNKPIRTTHARIGRQNPERPRAVEPRLAWEPEESPEVKESEEPEVNDSNDAEESPLAPDDESLHGATVVGAAVGAAVSFALTTGGGGACVVGAAVAKAPAMPAPATAVADAALTPMAIFCSSVKPAFLTATGAGVVVCGAHGS